jgi:hypothetical protein
VVLAQARLGKDVVGEAKKTQQEAKQAKTLGELVPVYLAVREKGDERLKALEAKSAQEGLVLTEAQVAALENAKLDKEAHGKSKASARATAWRRTRSMLTPLRPKTSPP